MCVCSPDCAPQRLLQPWCPPPTSLCLPPTPGVHVRHPQLIRPHTTGSAPCASFCLLLPPPDPPPPRSYLHAVVCGLLTPEGQVAFNPPDSALVRPGSQLILLGKGGEWVRGFGGGGGNGGAGKREAEGGVGSGAGGRRKEGSRGAVWLGAGWGGCQRDECGESLWCCAGNNMQPSALFHTVYTPRW